MANNNSSVVRILAVMVPLCAVLSLLLALVNSFTASKTAEIEKNAQMVAYKEISEGYTLGGEMIEVKDNAFVSSYMVLTSSDNSEKAVIINLVGKGYGGLFNLAASYKADGFLLDAKMISDSETPGLGKNSEERWYMKMFAGKDKIPASKSDLSDVEVQSITGASVTFNGVSVALRAGSDFVKELCLKGVLK